MVKFIADMGLLQGDRTFSRTWAGWLSFDILLRLPRRGLSLRRRMHGYTVSRIVMIACVSSSTPLNFLNVVYKILLQGSV